MRRNIYQNGSAKEFDLKLLNSFRMVKRLEDAEILFDRFGFHSGHCSISIPTKKWCRHILYHLNTIHNFPPAKLNLRLTNPEIDKIIKNLYQ